MPAAVKHCCKLRASRAYREESGSVLIVGQTPIQELAGQTAVKVLFLAEGAAPLPGAVSGCTCMCGLKTYMTCRGVGLLQNRPARAGVHAASTVVVTEAVLKKLSNLESVTGAD